MQATVTASSLFTFQTSSAVPDSSFIISRFFSLVKYFFLHFSKFFALNFESVTVIFRDSCGQIFQSPDCYASLSLTSDNHSIISRSFLFVKNFFRFFENFFPNLFPAPPPLSDSLSILSPFSLFVKSFFYFLVKKFGPPHTRDRIFILLALGLEYQSHYEAKDYRCRDSSRSGFGSAHKGTH